MHFIGFLTQNTSMNNRRRKRSSRKDLLVNFTIQKLTRLDVLFILCSKTHGVEGIENGVQIMSILLLVRPYVFQINQSATLVREMEIHSIFFTVVRRLL
jgi:hypothetical protein